MLDLLSPQADSPPASVGLSAPSRSRALRSIPRADQRLLARVRQAASELTRESDAGLRQRADQLREHLQARQGRRETMGLEEAFALAVAAAKRTLGFDLYDVQLFASLTVARGCVAEMATGEGKTLSALPALVWRGLMGQGVHAVTTNDYLAQRDRQVVLPACELLGLSVGVLESQAADTDKRQAYACDVTYGTGYEFGFDYLRDQLKRQAQADRRLGQRLLEESRERGQRSAVSEEVQRGLSFCLIDEVDHVLLDEAGSPLVLSEQGGAEPADAEAYRLARRLAQQLEQPLHFTIDESTREVELTALGRASVHGPERGIPQRVLRRAWSDYVLNALRAEHNFRRDVHYVVAGDEVQIVDAATGRIFADRSWQSGLHQAVEAKEGQSISSDRRVLAQITRQRFYRLYDTLAGMTGTAAGFEAEFSQVYRMPVHKVPLRVPNRRQQLPLRTFASREAKHAAILAEVQQVHRQTQRPILIGTRTIFESERLAARLEQAGLPFLLLNGKQDAAEAEIVAQAGERGRITIATNMAGRGTDIKLTDDVKSRGGLHVIIEECHDSSRVDRQLIGRAGRQGDPGSARAYLAAEDSVLQQFAPWLAASLPRIANRAGEIELDLLGRLRRIQRVAERQARLGRRTLLKRDLRLNPPPSRDRARR